MGGGEELQVAHATSHQDVTVSYESVGGNDFVIFDWSDVTLNNVDDDSGESFTSYTATLIEKGNQDKIEFFGNSTDTQPKFLPSHRVAYLLDKTISGQEYDIRVHGLVDLGSRFEESKVVFSGAVTVDYTYKEYKKFGVLLPLTGALADHGSQVTSAIKLAVDEHNSNPNSKYHLWYDIHDTATSNTAALDGITKFNNDGVKHIIGPVTSSNIDSVKDYVKDNEMIVISCCSSAPSLAVQDSIFRMVPSDAEHAIFIADLLESSGKTSIIPVVRDDTWGNDLHKSITSNYTGHAAAAIKYSTDNINATSMAKEISDAVAASPYSKYELAVMFLGFDEITDIMAASAKHANLRDVVWFGADANAQNNRMVTNSTVRDFAQDVHFTVTMFGVPENDVNRQLNATLTEKIGHPPTQYAFAVYDAVLVLGHALGNVTPPGSHDDLVEQIPRSVSEVDGALGAKALNAAGDLDSTGSDRYNIWQIRGGVWKVVNSVSLGFPEAPSLQCSMSLKKPSLSYGNVILGKISSPVTQVITNTGDLAFDYVLVSADDWSVGGTSDTVTKSVTEVSDNGTTWHPLSEEREVLNSLAAGSDGEVHMRMNLTDIDDPAGPYTQTVHYSATCG